MTFPDHESALHRRSIRLRGWNYSEPGLYFITICAAHDAHLFGRVIGGKMQPSRAGATVIETWSGLPERFPTIQLICFVLMPNHIHGVIAITRGSITGRKGGASPAPTKAGPKLAAIVGAFKLVSAIAVNRVLGCKGTTVWQRNYYEHIVRDGKSLRAICRCVEENPAHWNSGVDIPADAHFPMKVLRT